MLPSKATFSGFLGTLLVDVGMKAHEVTAAHSYENLEAWARQRWPVAQEVLYRWTGQVRRRGVCAMLPPLTLPPRT